jgi:uncharacterized RDD family membrane protein YckC
MHQPDSSISTPENVDLHLELAGIGNRALACTIDTGITYAVTLAVWMIAWGLLFVTKSLELPSNIHAIIYSGVIAVTVFVCFCVIFAYFIVFEGLWQGQTPGKRIACIRVIETSGQPVTWSGVIIRNLIRTFDVGFLCIGLIPIFADKKERRFGDFAANTIVIRERRPELQSTIRLSKNYDTEFDIGGITPKEYDLVVAFLKRRVTMVQPQKKLVAEQLANALRAKLPNNFEEKSSEDLIEHVYAAYNARAR